MQPVMYPPQQMPAYAPPGMPMYPPRPVEQPQIREEAKRPPTKNDNMKQGMSDESGIFMLFSQCRIEESESSEDDDDDDEESSEENNVTGDKVFLINGLELRK